MQFEKTVQCAKTHSKKLQLNWKYERSQKTRETEFVSSRRSTFGRQWAPERAFACLWKNTAKKPLCVCVSDCEAFRQQNFVLSPHSDLLTCAFIFLIFLRARIIERGKGFDVHSRSYRFRAFSQVAFGRQARTKNPLRGFLLISKECWWLVRSFFTSSFLFTFEAHWRLTQK